MNTIVNLYDRIYKHYRIVNSLITLGFDNFWRKRLIKIIKETKKPSKICDICCGTGDLTEILVKNFDDCDIYGVDANINMLKKAKEKLKNAKFIQSYISEMPFEDNFFDIVTISFATRNLFYSKDFKQSISQIKRILKPGGYFISIETSAYKNIFMNIFLKIYLNISINVINFIFPTSARSYNFLKSSIINFSSYQFSKSLEDFFKIEKIINFSPFPISVIIAKKL